VCMAGLLAAVPAGPVLAAPTTPTASPAATRAAAPTELRWTACGDGDVECASLPVPADHAAPDGDSVDLAVARVPAPDRADRIGVLVVNPGGPGVSGVDRLASLAGALPSRVRERFDVVSFDPRGVGGTTPIDCSTSLDGVFDASFSPDTDQQRAALVDAVAEVADACGRRNGDLLGQVSTLDAARDLDLLRAALGERRVSFLGYSYGTYLGSLYAAQYPERVRAMVLDGAVDPGVDALESMLLQARGFESNLDQFLAWCADDDDCLFHRDGRSTQAYDAVRTRLDEEPLVVESAEGRTLNVTRFDAAVLQLLYGGRASWTTLARALDETERGDGTRLLDIADQFVGRDPDGGDDDTVEAFWAISCLDGPLVSNLGEMTAIETAVRDRAPRLGGFVVNFSLACALWPARGAEAPPSIEGAAPRALVVSSAHDPATPLVSARNLARALGDASLVVGRGDRHTAFAGGNACVDDAVTGYLLAPGRSLAPLTRC
jgi:pimeloyl-ACP methyl ester carboxylesterase